MIKKILVSFCFAFIVNAQASEQIPMQKIEKLQVYGTYVVIWLTQASENLDECTKNGAKIRIGLEFDAGNKELYSAVLSARASGQAVGFGVSGCFNHGDGTIPKVYRVDF